MCVCVCVCVCGGLSVCVDACYCRILMAILGIKNDTRCVDLRNSHIKTLQDCNLGDIPSSLWSGMIHKDWLDSHLTAIPKPDKDTTHIDFIAFLAREKSCLRKMVARGLKRRECFRLT